MFNKENVVAVINELREDPKYFVSEAHLQMSFILKSYELNKSKFSYYPEYPIRTVTNKGENKTDEIDVMIFDKEDNTKTLIEFKHKTKNSESKKQENHLFVYTCDNIKIHPTNMMAQDLGRRDCWSDIQRLEKYKKDYDDIANAFFVFITNDSLYVYENGTDTYGHDFSMKNGSHENYVGKSSFEYKVFQDNSNDNEYDKYWYLVVDIK